MAKMSIVQEFEAAKVQLNVLLAKLNEKILALPDNPRIERLKDGCAFTISSKDLGSSWLPTHHDFRQTYKIIVGVISRCNPSLVVPTLRKMIECGQVIDKGRSAMTLHSDVVAHLKTILDETDTDIRISPTTTTQESSSTCEQKTSE